MNTPKHSGGRRRTKVWLAIAVVALAATGVAVAGGSATTSAVSATFTAGTIVKQSFATCTGSDGTYEITDATYSGTATSTDPNLNGAVWIKVRSTLNTTKNLGWLEGRVQITGTTSGTGTNGDLVAVNNAGQLQGFLSGHEQSPGAKLLANVSATFTRAAGFNPGSIGTGAATNTAITTTGSCEPIKPPNQHHGDDNDDDHGNQSNHGHSNRVNHKHH
jgi:hypothetical protein